MSEFQQYLMRLAEQRPEVERIRNDARARGDVATERNSDRLLDEWAALMVGSTPANDRQAA